MGNHIEPVDCLYIYYQYTIPNYFVCPYQNKIYTVVCTTCKINNANVNYNDKMCTYDGHTILVIINNLVLSTVCTV